LNGVSMVVSQPISFLVPLWPVLLLSSSNFAHA
jgi:hypothetical protein